MQQRILIGLILTLIVVVFIPFYWAMEPRRQEAARLRQNKEAVTRGSILYSTACAACHGVQGEGRVGPALRGTRLDDDALRKFIVRGVPGTVMPPWGKEDGGPFHKEQIRDLATFIKNWDTVQQETPVPSEQGTSQATKPDVVDSGEIFKNRCAACHGINREGVSGLAPALIPERLVALSDEQIKETISNGRSGTAMPSFSSSLNSEQIDSLLQFIKYTPP